MESLSSQKRVKIKILGDGGSMIDLDVRKKRRKDIAKGKLDVGISSSHTPLRSFMQSACSNFRRLR